MCLCDYWIRGLIQGPILCSHEAIIDPVGWLLPVWGLVAQTFSDGNGLPASIDSQLNGLRAELFRSKLVDVVLQEDATSLVRLGFLEVILVDLETLLHISGIWIYTSSNERLG